MHLDAYRTTGLTKQPSFEVHTDSLLYEILGSAGLIRGSDIEEFDVIIIKEDQMRMLQTMAWKRVEDPSTKYGIDDLTTCVQKLEEIEAEMGRNGFTTYYFFD